ncbi:MAG: hypothetical protein QM221_00455 [Bacillota bacterium]|nr:hypothetical protein [Bacillota bacterium]
MRWEKLFGIITCCDRVLKENKRIADLIELNYFGFLIHHSVFLRILKK